MRHLNADLLPAGLHSYEEVLPYYEAFRAHATSLIGTLTQAGYDLSAFIGGSPQQNYVAMLSPDSAAALAALVTPDLAAALPAAAAGQSALVASAAAATSVEAYLHGSVTAVLAAALVQVLLTIPMRQSYAAFKFVKVLAFCKACMWKMQT